MWNRIKASQTSLSEFVFKFVCVMTNKRKRDESKLESKLLVVHHHCFVNAAAAA